MVVDMEWNTAFDSGGRQLDYVRPQLFVRCKSPMSTQVTELECVNPSKSV